MKITLRQMTVFDAVARLGSVSEAAREVALTQSAASMALRDLERNLGVELFHRHRKRLLLNDNGRRLRPKMRSVLLEARDIEVTAESGEAGGALAIGASTTIGNYLMPRICSGFMRDHPGVSVALTVMPAREIINRVDDMALDLGFVESPLLRPTLRIQRWMDDELVVFCAPSHRLAGRKAIRPRDLAGENWCLQPLTSITRSSFTRVILTHLNTLHIGLETDSVAAIKQAVADGVGIGCQSRLAIAEELRAGTLRELRLLDVDLKRPFNVVSRKDVRQAALASAFVQHVLESDMRRERAAARRAKAARPRSRDAAQPRSGQAA
ncbi:MAG TPA: LysR substrate-binding domain-containing protein [Burkholderiales bacterium]|nr:LysR substrate-binding domain-containing protein [Burkholderiales bacterium]